MGRYRFSVVVFALFAVGLAAAVGCGPRDDRVTAEAPSTLYFVLGGAPTTRDPLASFDELTDAVLVNVYQSVLAPGAPPEYSACRAWTNPDPMTWDLEVRPALTFHDGSPLTVQDVAASLKAAAEDPSSPVHPFVASVKSVEVMGVRTVRLRTGEPSNIVPGLSFLPVLPGGRRPSSGALPIGSGPYKVVKWDELHRIVLQRVSQEAGSGRQPKEVVYLPARTAEEQIRLLRTFSPAIGSSLLREVRDRAEQEGLSVKVSPGTSAWYMVCNMRPGYPTASLEVRRALAASFDPAAFSKGLGLNEPGADDVVPPGVMGWKPGRYNPKPEWDSGKRPERPLRLLAMDTVEKAAGVVAGQLQERGWKVDLKVESVRRTLEQVKGADWDLTLIGFSCPTGEGLELYEFAFAGDAISSGGNFSRFEDQEVERLIEQARCALDPADRLNIEERIGDRLVRQLPWIPMIVTNRWAILHGKVKLPNGLPQRWWLTRLEIGG